MTWLRTPLLALAVSLAAACSSPPPTYEETLSRAREAKDAMLRDSPESPIPAARRTSWPALPYFPVDESFRAPAALKPPVSNADEIVMPTSTGKLRKMRRAGTLEFAINGRPLRLTAFTDLESPVAQRLFVPFGDLTNGKDTYPGGRYLDLDPTATGLYEIDFNRAYSPYCAYNPEYDCPYPPKENRLDVEIRAGEKYQAH